jgi:hypothetical protein
MMERQRHLPRFLLRRLEGAETVQTSFLPAPPSNEIAM